MASSEFEANMRRIVASALVGVLAFLVGTGCIFGVDTSSTDGGSATPQEQFRRQLLEKRWFSVLDVGAWDNPESGAFALLQFSEGSDVVLRFGPAEAAGNWSLLKEESESGTVFRVEIDQLEQDGCAGGPEYEDLCGTFQDTLVEPIISNTDSMVLESGETDPLSVLEGDINFEEDNGSGTVSRPLAFAAPEHAAVDSVQLEGTWSEESGVRPRKLVVSAEGDGVVSAAAKRGNGSASVSGALETLSYWETSYWGIADRSGSDDIPLTSGRIEMGSNAEMIERLKYPELDGNSSTLMCTTDPCRE